MITLSDTGQALSSAFATAVATDHSIVTRFEVWSPTQTSGPVYSSPISSTASNWSSGVIIDGSCTYSKDQDQRGQCQISIASPDGSLIPPSSGSGGILTPWGNEIRIFSGVQYANGTTEFVPMGYFRITQVQVTEQGGAVVMQVTGSDRSRNISRNVVQVYWPDATTATQLFGETPTVIGVNVTWPAMIQYVLAQFYPGATFNDTVAGWNQQVNDPPNCVVPAGAPPTFSEGTDMFDQMRQFAKASGCDLFTSRTGQFTFYRDPSFTFFSTTAPTPVVTWQEGSGAQFDQLQRNLNDNTAFNRVICYGAGNIIGQIAPLSSLVQYFGGAVSPGVFADDNDVNSPTYIGQVDANPGSLTYGQVIGPSGYGVVSNIVTNNMLVSQNQVNNFAQLTLRLNIGTQEQVVLNSGLTDPRIEVDDCVAVIRERDGVDTLYLVDSITIPLTSKQAMQMTVREHRNLTS